MRATEIYFLTGMCQAGQTLSTPWRIWLNRQCHWQGVTSSPSPYLPASLLTWSHMAI